jgi:hypothetical protein
MCATPVYDANDFLIVVRIKKYVAKREVRMVQGQGKVSDGGTK